MSSAYNPYVAPRASTPPLYYRRPEGVAPAYYPAPIREMATLRIPTTGTPRQAPPLSTTAATTTAPPPPPSPRNSYMMPAVSNPFVGAPAYQGPPAPLGTPRRSESLRGPVYVPFTEPTNPAAYLQQQSMRWSQQHQSDASRLEAEEMALDAEEVALKTKLAEMRVIRKRQEEEQLFLSQGWSTLLEREERYYTEPVPDLSSDIMAREQQCALLHDRLQQAEAHLHHLQDQLSKSDYIVEEREEMERELAKVLDGFEGIERRRRQCMSRAERYFDVETKRVVEGGRAVRKLDVQLREMTSKGPLAELQQQATAAASAPRQASRSASRGVTFHDKSIVLDIGRDVSTSSAEPDSAPLGLTSSTRSYQSTSADAKAYVARDEMMDSKSLCLGIEDEESGIGGTSVAFSLNNSELTSVKRRKMELMAGF